MEKHEGRCIFRSLHDEEAAKKIYETKKSNKMEALYASIQKQFDSKKNNTGDCVYYVTLISLLF